GGARRPRSALHAPTCAVGAQRGARSLSRERICDTATTQTPARDEIGGIHTSCGTARQGRRVAGIAHARWKPCNTSAGIGAERSRLESFGSRAVHTRFSKPSSAGAPPFVTRCTMEKLERPNALTLVWISMSSPYWEGTANLAPASTRARPAPLYLASILILVSPVAFSNNRIVEASNHSK